MVGGLALGSEIKRFARNRMTRIAVVVLMLMPLTYGALYLQDPAGAKALMLDYVLTFTDEIPPGRACAGDILLLSLPDTDTLPFLAISAGEHALAAHPGRGVVLIRLAPYRIMRAFRCRQLPQL